ncbi:MAG: hypothetical protein ACRYHQ_25945 [Janthinobacterium lividum]
MSRSDTGAAVEGEVVSGDDAVLVKSRRTRLKAARKAKLIATAEALSAGGTEAMAELNGLRRSVDQLVQGLGAMLEIQATHTEMVCQLLAAATLPDKPEPENRLGKQLDRIMLLLAGQGSKLAEIGATLRNLPTEVGSAVSREVASALDRVQ